MSEDEYSIIAQWILVTLLTSLPVKTQVAGKFQSNPTDYSKLRIFNLIELSKDIDEDSGVPTGEVRITEFGWKFLRGKASIPRYAYLVHNKVIGFSKELVFFNQCQDRFKLTDVFTDSDLTYE